MIKIIIKSIILLIFFIAIPQKSFSQEKAKQETAHEKAAKKVKDSEIIEMEAMKIEGKIQKPEVQYIMTRGNLSYKLLSNTKSFIKNVINSVKKNPF